MKKQVTFIAQSKGGTGKSFLTWFIAQNKIDDQSIFIDLDKSTRTSTRLTKILGEKRVVELSILDDNRKLDREMFLNLFETISKAKTNEWYVDLGAPESDELKSFFQNEVPAHELKEILEEIGIDLRILIVIAGADAINACIQYYTDMMNIAGEYIKIEAIKNEGTFATEKAKILGDKILEEQNISFKKVGSMPIGNSSKEVMSVISGVTSTNELSLAGKRSLKKMIEEVKASILA